jgi:cell division protein ZipA
MQSDIIVLYILPKADQVLIGSQINSSAQAMGLSFGEMNIFHYYDNGRNVFSLANMLEPGSFDANTIHDLKTTGLTVFMQIQGNDPLDDLTEMLQRSYQLAGLLDARLCNHKREPLTEQDAENYRTQVSRFAGNNTPELSSET